MPSMYRRTWLQEMGLQKERSWRTEVRVLGMDSMSLTVDRWAPLEAKSSQALTSNIDHETGTHVTKSLQAHKSKIEYETGHP